MLFVGYAFVVRSAAQDVAIGQAFFCSNGPAPDKLPEAIKPRKPDYPADLRKTDETGYVIAVRYIDPTGRGCGGPIFGSQAPFLRSVEDCIYDWKMKPAQVQNKPVGAWTWTPVIFNSKAADANSPDRIPRLLAVDLAILPADGKNGGETFMVLAKISVDATGAVTQSQFDAKTDPRLRTAAESALKNWKFAPARNQGREVAAEITLPVYCLVPLGPGKGEYVPPKLVKAVQPDYPRVMEKFGIDARVVVDFAIDRDGSVSHPFVTQSDNPVFDEPALKAVVKWQFQPGTVDGIKTRIIASQAIEFKMDGGGNKLFQLRGNADQSKLPPELRYDVPARIRNVQIPIYPHELRKKGVYGKAMATALIGPLGHVVAVKVRSADHEEFGLALCAALEGFSFDPPLKNGKATSQLINLEQKFNSGELPDDEGDDLMALEKRHPEEVISAKLLDEPLEVISAKPPLYPTGMAQSVGTGEALIEVLIDKTGHARLPRVITASDPAFGYAGVQALASWQFRPPHQNGRPVVSLVRIPLAFKQSKRDVPKNIKMDEPVEN